MPKGQGTRRTPLEIKQALEKKIAEANARLEIEAMKKQLKALTAQNAKIRAANGQAKKAKEAARKAAAAVISSPKA